MNNAFKLRLDILKNAKQIEDDSISLITKTIDIFKQEKITLAENNGAMLVTHLVMANERIKRSETINAIDANVFEQLKTERLYPKAASITAKIVSLMATPFIENEKNYILMHVLTILKGEQ